MTDQTNAPDNLESVMRRVAKLMAMASDDRGNAAEAAAAAGMAERIMRKYQIDNVDIITAELKRAGVDSFDSVDVGSTLNPEAPSVQASGFAGILAVAVAMFTDCQCRFWITQKYGKTLRFSGYKADTAVARFTYVYLVSQMNAATATFKKENTHLGRRHMEAFRRGFNASVIKLLQQATSAKKAAMQDASNSRELVLVKSTAVAAHFGQIKYARSAGVRSSDSFEAGRERGSRVDVTRRGIEGGSSSAARLGN